MHTQANDDYVPFGDEWRREMMRWRKADLVEFLRRRRTSGGRRRICWSTEGGK